MHQSGCSRGFVLVSIAMVLALSGCDDGGGDPDAGGDAGEATPCGSDVQCSDNVFCNGVERCMPGHAAADLRGCLPPANEACLPAQVCEESSATCRTECAVDDDADDDGHAAIECGGDDCDDGDANTYPGNAEVCDAEGHDEDCDIATLGSDGDGDGVVSSLCCNAEPDGDLVCGRDCDDALVSVRPGGTEVCNGRDEDCDSVLDEGVFQTFYEDADGDEWGRAPLMRSCVPDPRYVEVEGDCNDSDAAVHPEAPEVCDGIDNDCDSDGADEIDSDTDMFLNALSTCDDDPVAGATRTKDDCNDTAPAVRACGTLSNADAICAAGRDSTAGQVCAITRCDPGFSDCDESALNGCEVDLRTSAAHCGACGASCATGTCVNSACIDTPHTVARLGLGGRMMCAVFDEGGGRGPIACWGSGMFGDGTGFHFDQERPRFVRRSDGSFARDATQLAIGDDHACYLDEGGLVWCWGSRNEGRAGDGEIEGGTYAFPSQVPGLTGVVELAAGYSHTCARTGTGDVHCWGSNLFGQFGTAGGVPVATPTLMLSGASAIAVGDYHACAIVTADRVRCWGRNGNRLGEGSTASEALPVEITRVGTPILADAISAGGGHTCVLRGTAMSCWGDNANGQLGAARATAAWRTPEVVVGLLASEIAAGGRHTCAERTDGTIVCWGSGDFGQIGDGASLDSLGSICDDDGDCGPLTCSPSSSRCERVVTTPGGPVLEAATNASLDLVPLEASDVVARGGSSCALRAGRIRCWGENTEGQLGTGGAPAGLVLAAPTRALVPPTHVGGSRNHSCARLADGRLRCAGATDTGILLDAAASDVVRQRTVADVDALDDVLSTAATYIVGCALGIDGRVRCWGGLSSGAPTAYGGLGNGSTTGSAAPVLVSDLTGVVSLAGADLHFCAVGADGGVDCWGAAAAGQLGDGVATHSSCAGVDCSLSPVAVAGLTGVAEVAVGGVAIFGFGAFSCARRIDGTVACWGDNSFGVLGNGTSTSSSTPVEVTGLTDVIDIDAGATHACAVRSNGRVMCWGTDVAGELGDEATHASCGPGPCSRVPVEVTGVTDAVSVATIFSATCVRTVDDRVRCWGSNGELELGEVGGSRNTPAGTVPGLLNVRALRGSGGWFCAQTRAPANEFFCWGEDDAGQLGRFGFEIAAPTLVLGL